MDFRIRDARPIWQQLTEQMTERIVTGVYDAGTRFPSVRELAAEAGVNPNTMQRAMAALESDGLVVTNRTAGRMVTEDVTIVAAVRLVMTSPSASSCVMARCMVLGLTPASAASSRTEGKRLPGA